MSDSTERAAVVAWLRGRAAIDSRVYYKRALYEAADAIERGDHIKGDSDDT